MSCMGMSKGVWRLALAVLAVLLVLSLPVFGADKFGRMLLWCGVPVVVTIFAPVGLYVVLALLFFQCVYSVLSRGVVAVLRHLLAYVKKAFLAAFRAVHGAAFQDDMKK